MTESGNVPQEHITEDDLAELIRRTGNAAYAHIRGDIRGYLELIKHSADGVPPRRNRV